MIPKYDHSDLFVDLRILVATDPLPQRSLRFMSVGAPLLSESYSLAFAKYLFLFLGKGSQVFCKCGEWWEGEGRVYEK